MKGKLVPTVPASLTKDGGIGVNTSKVVDPGPSMRQLCGGNIFSIEKLIAFGKTLQNIYKDMTNEIGNNPENENLMK